MIPRWIVFLLLIASVICVEQCSSQVRRQSVDHKNAEQNSQQKIPKSCSSGMQPLVDVYNFFIYSLSQLTVTTVLLVISLILLFYYICFFHSNARIVGSGCDFELQSVPLEKNSSERISCLLKDDKQLVTTRYERVSTMNDILYRGYLVSNNGHCLGMVKAKENKIDWMTYMTLLCRLKRFADGLIALGVKPNKQACIGIYSANCPEYMIVEYACYRQSFVVVPVYDTLGANVCSYIANQVEMTTIACDNVTRISNIIEQADKFKTLKNIILMKSEQAHDDLFEKVKLKGFKLYTLDQVEHLGETNELPDSLKPTPADLAIICYTSGTTSLPKGVMLTHGNLIASISSLTYHLLEENPTCKDVMISILPLAHMFERIGEACMLLEGGKVCYYSGDIQQLANEIKIIQPSIMLAVPRLLNRIHQAIQARVRDSWFKRTMLHLAYCAKKKDLERHVLRKDTIWDHIVFNKIRENFGSNLRLICVGSAPLSHEVLDFLRCALGCVISEGYGQTECVGPCTATLMGDHTTGHVGPPLVSSIVKLEDFPEMNYYAADGKGEILVKGPVVFQGYYKMPDKTAEALKDGWLYTGDIGAWTKEGSLQLIDRKKNIFKLAQGEYIVPEKIENILLGSEFVEQIFIYGHGLKSAVVAIVVPKIDYLKKVKNPVLESLKTLDESTLNTPKVKRLFIEDMQRIGKKEGLKSFELPKNIHIHMEPFTVANGYLTPSLKSKRNVITQMFQKTLDEMYEEWDYVKATTSKEKL